MKRVIILAGMAMGLFSYTGSFAQEPKQEKTTKETKVKVEDQDKNVFDHTKDAAKSTKEGVKKGVNKVDDKQEHMRHDGESKEKIEKKDFNDAKEVNDKEVKKETKKTKVDENGKEVKTKTKEVEVE